MERASAESGGGGGGGVNAADAMNNQNFTEPSLPSFVAAGEKQAAGSGGANDGADVLGGGIGNGGGGAAAAASSPSTCSGSPVTTEQLALIGFTARLGATVTNEDAEDTATREEARLLMSLMGKKYGGSGAATSNRARLCSDGTESASSSRSASPECTDGFSFSCPSLSIEPARTGNAAARPYASPIPQRKLVACEAAASSASSPLAPAALFRRPLTVSGGRNKRAGGGGGGTNEMADTAETVATNVMRSFGAAAEWRGRAWMQSLGDVLSLREKTAAQGRGERLRGEFEAESGSGSGGGASGHAMPSPTGSEASTSSEQGSSEAGSAQDHQEAEEEEEEISNELKVIYALARSVSRIQIKSVRTSFRVQPVPPRAPQAAQGAGSGGEEEDFVLIAPEPVKRSGSRSGTPPPKKRRFRQVSASPTAELIDIEGRKIPTINGRYNVQHGLQFEAVLRVALPQENGLQQEQEVVLSAPGTVRGTFRKAPAGEGGSRAPSPEQGAEVLCGVEVKLDTDVLALSVERFSRLIVRKAAEADMLACAAEAAAEEAAAKQAQEQQRQQEEQQQQHQQQQQEYEEAQAHQQQYAYHQDPYYAQYYSAALQPESSDYPRSAVVTPKHYAAAAYASPLGSHSSGGSAGEIADIHMPPPSELAAAAQYGRPPQDPHASGYLFSPGPEGTQGGPPGGNSPGGPFVSPSPTAKPAAVGGGAADLPYAPAPEEERRDGQGWYGSDDPVPSQENVAAAPRLPAPRPDGEATSLPALLEVACAAMHES